VHLLIGQGTNEVRVAQAESDQIVEAIRQANRPVEYIVYTDEGHGLPRPENRLHFVAKAQEFRSHGRLRHFAGSGVRAILYIALDTGRAGPPAGRHAARPPGCGSAERESQVRSIAVQ